MHVWRLGYWKNPCDFIPRKLCKWHHRFDDPQKEYRTLYAAQDKVTCLRELLADLRPNSKAIEEFEEWFGASGENGLTIAGVVSAKWRQSNVLVEGNVQLLQGRFINIETPAVRQRLEKKHATLLQSHGIKRLSLAHLRTRERMITQSISRTFFNDGKAGIHFRSRLDRRSCYALFEGRALLRQTAAAIPLIGDIPELMQVCGEFTLVLRPV